MRTPWLHYEAYDIKVYNNVFHDIRGAGLSVSGGYNILMAYNTLYRVGGDDEGGRPGGGLRVREPFEAAAPALRDQAALRARLSGALYGNRMGRPSTSAAVQTM
jgi:hypothetical protein